MAIKETLLSWWSSETAEARESRRRHTAARRGPSPSDKYLPIWVIGAMSASVAILLLLMTIVCGQQRCKVQAAAAPPIIQTPADKAASAAEAATAAAKAAAAAASR